MANKLGTKSSSLFVLLLIVVGIAWRWLWGGCWNPLETACFEGAGEGDFYQHYYGWLAYAKDGSDSLVPPLFSNWTWPIAVPVLYADPIPIAAMAFRPIYQIIKVNFQYFSLLTLVSMLISAGCGYMLGCRIVGSRLSGFTLGILLALAPPALVRMGGHEALSLHCLLVVPITLLLLRKASVGLWGLIIFVGSGVHAYYLPLLLPFVVVRTISNEIKPTRLFYRLFSGFFAQRSQKQSILVDLLARLSDAICLSLSFFLGFFLFGYGTPGMSPAADGDLWSANMLALFDSQGHSALFGSLNKVMPFQWEGYSYLGVLITLFVALSLYRQLDGASSGPVGSRMSLFPSPRLYWSLILASFIYSFGFNFYLGNQFIFGIHGIVKSLHLDQVYATFRSTGRFAWPMYYSLLLWGFCSVAKSVRRQKVLALIVFVLLFENHVFTLSKVKAGLSQRFEAGIHWRADVELARGRGRLARLIGESDLFYNATGEPYWWELNSLPKLFVSASKPDIRTNFTPYLARTPLDFRRHNSGNGCDLAVRALRLASEQGLQNPLLMMKNDAASGCTQLELRQRFGLEEGLSIYSARLVASPP
jgi:hypothetical protein